MTGWRAVSDLPHSRCHDDDAVTTTTASIIASKHPVRETFATEPSTPNCTRKVIKVNSTDDNATDKNKTRIKPTVLASRGEPVQEANGSRRVSDDSPCWQQKAPPQAFRLFSK